MLDHRTFYSIQKIFVISSHKQRLPKEKERDTRTSKEREWRQLVGDGRCDSSGFSATFGIYMLMNESNNEVIDFFISHVRKAGNSQNIEKYGLKFLLHYLASRGVKIDRLTTDPTYTNSCVFEEGMAKPLPSTRRMASLKKHKEKI